MRKTLIIGLCILVVAFISFEIYHANVQKRNESVIDFDSCVNATGRVLESYPRQCIFKGETFVEFIGWNNDGISLAKVKEDGSYACFGCNSKLCVDPVIDSIDWVTESSELYCGEDFQIIQA